MTLIGTIIGVGIFGVPYAISRVGVVVALIYFVVLGGIQLLQSLFYAEAAIVCDDKLRLIGLVGRYLGPRARHVAAASTVLGFWGGMVAYVVVGGSFVTLDALRSAVGLGVRGILTGGLDQRDLTDFLGAEIGLGVTGDERVGLTIIMLGGFGVHPITNDFFDLLSSMEGNLACIDGTTQIRTNMLRPEVIIPI